MPRRKISEFRSKKIVTHALGLDYIGWEVINGVLPKISHKGTFVVKVDQAVKKRFKQGLVFLNVTHAELPNHVKKLQDKGYSAILIEPYHQHDTSNERYLSLVRQRDGIVISYSQHGGIEIENHADSITTGLINDMDVTVISKDTGLAVSQLETLIALFDTQYMSLLEINPYTVTDSHVTILDCAIEVDSAAELLVDGWTEHDLRSPTIRQTEEEAAVKKLSNDSPASFSLEVINPDGAIFLLLSGGGASVVIADEIFMMGYGKHLANYGEYSGNPNTEETELYAEQVIRLLLASRAKNKVVFIGGAVANFTDIKNTFKGIISVIEKHAPQLEEQGVTFYVRRGGPRQKEGLIAITKALERLNLKGGVYDPSVSIPSAVAQLVKGLS